MIKYSFVIPSYQNKVLLKNTLETLNYQGNRKDYEVVLIDDGSTDNTYDYIKDVNRNYNLKYIYIERDEKSCRSRARNRGIEESQGEIIVFIDSDILIKEDYLEELDRCYNMDTDLQIIGLRYLLQKEIPIDIIRSKYIFNRSRVIVDDICKLEKRHHFFNEFSYNLGSLRYPWMYAFTCNMVVPKRWLKKVNGFDENIRKWGTEDVDLAYRLYKEGLKIIINKKLEVFHQFHGEVDLLEERDRKEGAIENSKYFLKKFPNIFHVSDNEVLEIVTDTLQNRHRELELYGQSQQKVILEFNDIKKIDDVKSKIIELSNQKGITLIVIDHLEVDNCDIWIQLLGKRQSTPRYYFANMQLENEEFSCYNRLC